MVTLREATEEDLEAIRNIELDVYPSAWTLNFFRMMLGLNGDLFIVAVENETIVGYTVGEVTEMKRRETQETVGHVLNVAVRKDYQGKGIGTTLMDELEGRMIERGVGIAYLEVRESNAVAQAMYRKRGYQYVRTVEGYYGEEDGFIMMRSLTR